MNIEIRPEFELDDAVVALADRTRRDIVARPAEGEARVTDVARPFDRSLGR